MYFFFSFEIGVLQLYYVHFFGIEMSLDELSSFMDVEAESYLMF